MTLTLNIEGHGNIFFLIMVRLVMLVKISHNKAYICLIFLLKLVSQGIRQKQSAF